MLLPLKATRCIETTLNPKKKFSEKISGFFKVPIKYLYNMKDLRDIIKEELKNMITEQGTRVSYRKMFEVLSKVMAIGKGYEGTVKGDKVIVKIGGKTYNIDGLLRLFDKHELKGDIDVIVTADLTRSGKRAWLLNVKGEDESYGLDITYKHTRGQ